MKFDENLVFIKFHQSSFFFQNLDFFDALWWNLMKNYVFIKFHQNSFFFKTLIFLMNFDEICFHQILSKFSFFFKTLILLMKFDEIWWKQCFHQILSKFNFYFQSLEFFDEPVKKKLIELDRIGLALIFLKPFFQFINPFKTKTNRLNSF